MSYINDLALDDACQWFIDNVTRLDICNAEPTNYTEATSTYTIGNKTGQTMTGPADGATDGRKCTFPAVTDGTVTSDDDATHWAISKTSATTALGAAGSISGAPVTVSTVVDFATDAFDITFRDAA